VRFIDDIIIIGKGNKLDFNLIHDRLVRFLKSRGLTVDYKLTSEKFEVFAPGKSFSFLGFLFTYPDKDSVKFKKGRFTKFDPYNFVMRLKNLEDSNNRSRLLITIRPKSLKKIKLSLMKVTDKKNSIMDVKNIIQKVNLV
jgi:hypothetical protein